MLTANVSVDATDVLVLSQTISPLAFGFNCVDVSARVLGSTRKDYIGYYCNMSTPFIIKQILATKVAFFHLNVGLLLLQDFQYCVFLRNVV